MYTFLNANLEHLIRPEFFQDSLQLRNVYLTAIVALYLSSSN